MHRRLLSLISLLLIVSALPVDGHLEQSDGTAWMAFYATNMLAVAFETGIQNSGLGLVLIFNFFDGLGGMAIVTACWSTSSSLM